MKLVSFSQLGEPARVGAVVNDDQGTRLFDLSAASAGYRSTQQSGGFLLPSEMIEFLETGASGHSLAKDVIGWATETRFPSIPLNEVTLAPPVPRPAKIYALAGNYQEHVIEGGRKPVEKSKIVPQLFIKPPTTLLGHKQSLRLPTKVSKTIDWELELAVIIGRRGKYIPVEQALDFVAGYTIFNDISSRTLDIASIRIEARPRDAFFDWLNGKWQDGFGLMGPYLVTSDEIPDPHSLHLRLLVNNEIRQEGSTNQMIFSVSESIAWASSLSTLEPGDVIATGTPAGVGSASGNYLKDGDTLCGEIEGLGRLSNDVVAE